MVRYQGSDPSSGSFLASPAHQWRQKTAEGHEGDDAKGLQEMMIAMSQKPCEANIVPEPEPTLPSEATSAAPAFDGDDAKGL